MVDLVAEAFGKVKFVDRRLEVEFDVLSSADHIDLAPSRDRLSNETRNKQPSLAVQRHWVERSIVIFEFEVGVLGGIDLFHVALQLGLGEDPKDAGVVRLKKNFRLARRHVQPRPKRLRNSQSTLGIDELTFEFPEELHAFEPLTSTVPAGGRARLKCKET